MGMGHDIAIGMAMGMALPLPLAEQYLVLVVDSIDRLDSWLRDKLWPKYIMTTTARLHCQ